MIDHICLLVKNLDKSKTYYETVFSLSGKRHPADASVYMLENRDIHFFIMETDAPDQFIREQHLSIEIESIEKAEKILAECGITDYEKGIFNAFDYRNYKWIEWRDSNGIRLEFVEYIT
ncbi:VOC family protein [Brucepastera parasyntrophica]|uniref:VOC family protein n=1 Tax=Brucepastera parasyntrophica TaxID=2880008 RepID=UPI00210E0FE2|nr:VOC family protein [Brucepastera parasyntrophica]ULQ58620.1 VOC family protein [Brucepastera parasyntrophica]